MPLVKFPLGEPAAISRDDNPVETVLVGYDPHEGALYLPAGTNIVAGDSVDFRGELYRVTKTPEVWRNPFTAWDAGTVAYVEPLLSVAALPDTGRLERLSGTVYDRDTKQQVPTWAVLWTGPCLVDAPASDGSVVDLAEQRISIQPFTVSVPLAVVDLRPDDRFVTTASLDTRLIGRPLQVLRVKAGSLAQVRQFVAIENQG